jgi:hypothetical protein
MSSLEERSFMHPFVGCIIEMPNKERVFPF